MKHQIGRFPRQDVTVSRRSLFEAGAAVAIAAAAPLLPAAAEAAGQAAEDAGTLDRSRRQAPASNQRILLKGGTIISMDPQVGNFAKGDVLIEGKKIIAVGGAGQVKSPSGA